MPKGYYENKKSKLIVFILKSYPGEKKMFKVEYIVSGQICYYFEDDFKRMFRKYI